MLNAYVAGLLTYTVLEDFASGKTVLGVICLAFVIANLVCCICDTHEH